MKYQGKVKLNRGFTLVELIIVLSLLLMILTAVYTFFDYTQKVYTRTETQNILQDEVNKFNGYLASDIRSASKPDFSTKAILVYKNGTLGTNGNRIDIFDYKENKFYKTSYIYEDNTIKRGVAERSTAAAIKLAPVTYETVLEGVECPSGEEMFKDITKDEAGEINDRRNIEINMIIKDPHAKINKAYNYTFSYTSRTKGAP
ncbi:MAG: PulJ/GspJ family protein [Acetivibrionales bacterium]|jgi:prepilin-type N-terminal cleavage/methylation domain-containing protein